MTEVQAPSRGGEQTRARTPGAAAGRRLHDGDLPVIFAHHMGEQLLLGSLAAGGTTAATGMLVFGRARLETVLRWLLRR